MFNVVHKLTDDENSTPYKMTKEEKKMLKSDYQKPKKKVRFREF